MKRIVLVLMVLCVTLTGCDVFRKLAGRPTSADINLAREQIAAEQAARKKAYEDSLEFVAKQRADSLAVIDSLGKMNNNLRGIDEVGAMLADSLSYRYYIVIGSFRDKNNADYMQTKVEKEGYEAYLLSMRNGYTAVSVCPSNKLTEVFASLHKVRDEDFCPSDAWILVSGSINE